VEAVVGPAGQGALDRGGEAGRHVRRQGGERRGAALVGGTQRRQRAGAREGPPAGQQLVADDSEAVHVAAGVGLPALGHLGVQVLGGEPGRARRRHRPLRDPAGGTEVRQQRLTVGGEQDVAWLHVAVQDAPPVRGGECVGDRRRDAHRLGWRAGARVAQQLGQRPAGGVLHDDRESLTVRHQLEHADDVGVVQRGEHLPLAAEPGDEIGPATARQALDRHQPSARRPLPCTHHRAHGAGPEDPLEVVPGKTARAQDSTLRVDVRE